MSESKSSMMISVESRRDTHPFRNAVGILTNGCVRSFTILTQGLASCSSLTHIYWLVVALRIFSSPLHVVHDVVSDFDVIFVTKDRDFLDLLVV